MKHLLILLLLSLSGCSEPHNETRWRYRTILSTLANACESYESCLETAKWQTKLWGDDNGPQDELAYAIAYKLDEISEKLDRK